MMGAWTINVSGRIYGPFTSERMRSFVGEGRLAPHSLVARDGSTDWHEAREEPEFSDVFSNRAQSAIGGAAARAAPAAPLAHSPQAAPSLQPNASHAPQFAQVNPVLASHSPHANGTEATEQQSAHFVVIAEIKAQSTRDIEGAIGSLGAHYRLTHNVWIISTDQSVMAVRNRLLQELGKTDSLFVIDASRGKAAWFNFGPEADVRIRRVWQKT
jgi:hypothetical protein